MENVWWLNLMPLPIRERVRVRGIKKADSDNFVSEQSP
jgi:hypothetical protein